MHVDNGLPQLMLLSNRVGIRCYGADPGRCCRWSRTMDILDFPAILRRSPATGPESQRGVARFAAWLPVYPGSWSDQSGRLPVKARPPMVRWVGSFAMKDRESGPGRTGGSTEAPAGE